MNTRTIWVLAALAVAAQAGAGIEEQLADCAAIADRLKRLICYDDLAASVAGTPAAEQRPEPRQQPAPDPEAEFGIVQRKEPEEPKQDLDKIHGEVADVDRDPYGALIITFTNGQVWKQIDQRGMQIRKGDTVFVAKGALRSFLLGSDSHNVTIRVKRIR